LNALRLARDKALDNANQKRKEDAKVLKELVAEEHQAHRDWSHVQIAKKLEADGVRHKNGKPYTARRIGQIRNDQRSAGRKFGR
jgi:hypothetical protein